MLVVAVAVLTGSVVAGASAKGKPPTTGANCKPQISVILKGTLAANGATAPTTLSVKVTGGNHYAKAYKAATQPISVTVTTSTKVIRGTSKSAADLKSGDLVNIRATACKADLAKSATPPLTAVRVTAHAKP
jgi:hypothetical protein